MRAHLIAVAIALAALPASAGKEKKPPAAAVDPVTGEKAEPAPQAPAPAPEAKADAPAPAPAPEAKAEPLPPPKKVDPKLLDEALQDFFTARYKDAAGKLYGYLEATPPTDENHAWAQYFLAESLVQLGLRHAGATYLAKIARERSNPNVIPKALASLRDLTDGPHDERMIDEQVFGALDLGFLPEEIANYVHYQQGMVDLKVGNERWANTHFAKLPEDSAEASRAKFALLVTRLKTSQRELPKKMIEEFLELSKDEKLTPEMRNEALFAVARLRYELKDHPGALEAYGQVKLPPLDPGRATLYLEEAWTRYQLGQIHPAMGILTTLEAPAFRDEFLPDKYMLRALIYRDMCHYLPAKRAAKELTRRFADSLEAIHEREDLTKDLRLRRAAISHGPAKRAERFLETVELEAESVGKYAGSFGERLYAHLVKLYSLSRAEAIRTRDERLAEATREEADRLLRAAEQVRLMEYEVGLKLYERIKKGSKLVTSPEEEPLTASQVAFFFEGEYWNDELRSYRFSLKSRCIEETAQ